MILDGKVSVNMSACNDADGDLPTRHFFFLPQMKESNLHVYAAVNTILSYSLWHVLMAVSLFALSAHARSRLSDEQARPMLPPGDVKAIDFQSINLLLFLQKQNLTQSISAWSMQTRLVSWRIEHGK